MSNRRATTVACFMTFPWLDSCSKMSTMRPLVSHSRALSSIATILFLSSVISLPLRSAAILEQKLRPLPRPESGFGVSMAISGDTLVIGANHRTAPLSGEVGAAYIFAREGTNWLQRARLAPSHESPEANFGGGVAIFGSTAIIGASGDSTAYIFVRDGDDWMERGQFFTAQPTAARFGGGDIPMTGSLAFISATGSSTVPPGGVVYVFSHHETGWSEQTNFFRENWTAGLFGGELALSGDSLLVGAPRDTNAYVFVRDGANWREEVIVNTSTNVFFGEDVALSGDTALIGAPDAKGTFSGKAFIYVREGTNWNLQATLFPPKPNLERPFAQAVALQDSRAIVYGSTAALHVYTRSGTNWVFDSTIIAEPDGQLAPALLLSGNHLFVKSVSPTESTVNVYRLLEPITLNLDLGGDSLSLTIASRLEGPVAIDSTPSLDAPWTQLTELELNGTPYILTLPRNAQEPARFLRARQLSP